MRQYSTYRSGTRLGACALIALGFSVLVGWSANIPSLLTVVPGRISMKPNSAIAFVCAGLAILYLTKDNLSRNSRAFAAVFSSMVLAIAAITLVEYSANLNLGIDQFLFKDPLQYSFPGRMAHITAVNFCLAGVSLLLMSLSARQAVWPQLLSLLTGLSAVLAIIGYLYGVPLLYGSIEYTSMALHTGLGFLILSAAILHCRPTGGLMAVVSSPHAGGWLSRRLMPIAILVPVILGAVYLRSNFALKDPRLALACLMVSQSALFLALLWALAFVLNRSEAERNLATEARRHSEANYRTMFEEAIIGMFQSSPEGRLLTVNPAMARMYGYESGQEMIDVVTDIGTQLYVDPERRREFKRLLHEQGSVRNFDCQVYRKDGSRMWQSVNARAIVAEGAVIRYDGTFEDITERKSLEDQLRQAQKMEAVGRLAGGVAHDFNNALGVIVGYSTLLKDRLLSDTAGQRYADEIGKAGQRAASLTRQLLAFSRKQVVQPLVLNLNEVVTETEKMLRRLIGEDIEMIIVRHPTLGNVRADLGQIDQVLMNLVVNARDAMPQGGRLVIETANADLDETNLGQHYYAKPGRYVVLSVSDTGCGMDKETQAHIFEPFFTTKGPGQGTGLGLSTVYGIVKQSDGYVWVYSEPGNGARFKVYLPRVEAAASKLLPADKSAVPGGSETILLVEDDEAMRTLTKHCLRQGGYTVLDVPDGEVAIRAISEHQGDIHLLLTDVVMPGVSGRQLAQSLAVARPGMRLLYMSGYTADIIAGRGILEPEVDLLEKPFTQEALLRRVRKALDGEPFTHVAAAGQS
jgi:PAS domain S-box-containing protein